MALKDYSASLLTQLNTGNNNTQPAYLGRILGLGQLVRQNMPHSVVGAVPTVGVAPYDLATGYTVVLPDMGKAAAILRATGRTGTVTGEYTPVAAGTTPTTGQCAVSPCGNIVFAAADAPTLVDILYIPLRYDIFEFTFVPVSNAITIPTGYFGLMLLEAEALLGTTTGLKQVLAPAAGAPATGQARLNVAKTTVTFATADAVTSGRMKVACYAAIDPHVLIEASPSIQT
jgi:hypothetical protein